MTFSLGKQEYFFCNHVIVCFMPQAIHVSYRSQYCVLFGQELIFYIFFIFIVPCTETMNQNSLVHNNLCAAKCAAECAVAQAVVF